MDSIVLGERIRRAREAIGLKQDELGEAVELDQRSISELERGRRKLTVQELPRFAEALQKPLYYFLEADLKEEDWDHILLEAFRKLPTPEVKQLAIEVMQNLTQIVQVVRPPK